MHKNCKTKGLIESARWLKSRPIHCRLRWVWASSSRALDFYIDTQAGPGLKGTNPRPSHFDREYKPEVTSKLIGKVKTDTSLLVWAGTGARELFKPKVADY
ncbi:conserved hypothetical protein [Ricinus communis]|uniref:Uncharacterized protein n=1 Tax=Ricinus communis TaxID=3988 RepID=B9R8X4_RICCO|nr:conserved hypothetical protein [Ricinus communis]